MDRKTFRRRSGRLLVLAAIASLPTGVVRAQDDGARFASPSNDNAEDQLFVDRDRGTLTASCAKDNPCARMTDALTLARAIRYGLDRAIPMASPNTPDDTPQVMEQSETARARVRVRVYGNGVVGRPTDQTVALRAAASVLAAAGIDVEWLLCGEHAAAANPRLCETPFEVTELSVRFVPLPGVPSADGRLRLGYSVIDTTSGAGKLATVYADRVRWLAGQAEADARTLLGLATAHEVGHLLLGSNAHAAAGLMRAVWSRAELRRGEVADWLFAAPEGARMRSSIAQREALRGGEAVAPVTRIAARTE